MRMADLKRQRACQKNTGNRSMLDDINLYRGGKKKRRESDVNHDSTQGYGWFDPKNNGIQTPIIEKEPLDIVKAYWAKIAKENQKKKMEVEADLTATNNNFEKKVTDDVQAREVVGDSDVNPNSKWTLCHAFTLSIEGPKHKSVDTSDLLPLEQQHIIEDTGKNCDISFLGGYAQDSGPKLDLDFVDLNGSKIVNKQKLDSPKVPDPTTNQKDKKDDIP